MEENGNSRSSADSVEMSTIDSSPQILNGHISSDEENGYPYLEIVEQPQQRGFRFRYECEGPSHGGLQGASSEKYRKTNPTIKIRNYSGAAKVYVNLVTDEPVPKPHAHRLVGKNCTDGICMMDVKPGTAQITFPNLCIQHVTRKKASEVLEQRICSAMIDERKREEKNWTLNVKLSDDDKKRAKQEAAAQAKGMQLNVVRLCFQCYLTDNDGKVLGALKSVVSDPIFDCKAPGANALKICRMDKYSGCCTGNDEVFLLCEKVQKDDIMVRFLEQDADGNIVWEAYGHFGPFDVHRQFAIVFKTPEYRDVNIQSPVNVLVMLQRKSDSESSDPKSFTYYPRIRDKEDIDRKRRKLLPSYNHGGSGFSGMNPSIGGSGGSGSGGSASNGGDGTNGVQNGSIPDFSNLPLSQFGQRAMNMNGRQVLQAKRSQQVYRQPMAPALYSDAPADVIANSTEFLYEEVSHLSPPMAGLQGVGSPQYYNGGASHTIGSPTDSAMMVGSPQNVGHNLNSQFMSGNRVVSPHLSMQHSPQSNLGSQQLMICSQNQSLPMTETVISSSQTAQMASDLQMTMSDLKLEQYSQPMQATSLSVDSIETDFFPANSQLNSQMYDQFNPRTLQGMDDKSQIFDMAYLGSQLGPYQPQPPQHYGIQSCAWQARGSDVNLEDVIDVLGDMVDGAPPRDEPCEGFDEVDSARVDKFEMTDLVARSSGSSVLAVKSSDLVPEVESKQKTMLQTAKVEPGITKAVTVSDDENQGPLPYAPQVAGNTVPAIPVRAQEPAVERKNMVAMETRAKAAATVKKESSVQTEMDPLLKLSMKMSQALQYYAASGDIRSLLMVQRFLMPVQDQDGDLPLHTALINQRYEVFQNILDVMVTLPDSYCRINAYNFLHQTPLHLAVITNQPNAVDLLIRAGADTTLVDRNGNTPAHLAVLYGRDECLKNLLKYLRPDVSKKEPFPELNVRCYDGYTPAHLACQQQNLAAMKLLVWAKAQVNLPDGKSGRTPLHHAVEADDLSLAAYLILEAGADVNVKRFDGNTALHIACGRLNVGMVALLMAGGADPDIENDDITDSSDDAEYGDSEESANSDEGEEKNESNKNDENEKVRIEDSEDKDKDTEKSLTKKEVETRDKLDCVKRSRESRFGRGLVPADFAGSNNKILRILNGESYSSITELEPETRIDSGIDSHSSGDMFRVHYMVRKSLSELLDPPAPGSDWQALAKGLNVELPKEKRTKRTSPVSSTRLLLNVYEEEGGTVSRLVQALSDIKRDDCISVLGHLVDQSSITGSDKDISKDPKYDSGVSDSFLKSSSPVHSTHIVT